LELHLDRRWFLIEPWKAVFTFALDLVRRARSSPRIVVPPMSEAWLQEHGTSYPKHTGDQY
jgi:hypothetical protein